MAHSPKASEAAKEKFVTLLRRHRIAVGLTQTELAKKLDVVPSTVSFWESGDSFPHPKLIPDLARFLQIDPMELTRVIEPEMAHAKASK